MRLTGLHILLVEDDILIGLDLRQTLEEAGATVTGPIARVSEGVAVAASTDFDFAVLDFRIIGGSAQPIAETLIEHHVPFLFYTASETRVADLWPKQKVISKPADPELLVQTVAAIAA